MFALQLLSLVRHPNGLYEKKGFEDFFKKTVSQ